MKPTPVWCSPKTSRCCPAFQRGLHQPGLTHVVLSNEERRIISMHRNLERYLQLSASDRITGGEPVGATASKGR